MFYAINVIFYSWFLFTTKMYNTFVMVDLIIRYENWNNKNILCKSDSILCFIFFCFNHDNSFGKYVAVVGFNILYGSGNHFQSNSSCCFIFSTKFFFFWNSSKCKTWELDSLFLSLVPLMAFSPFCHIAILVNSCKNGCNWGYFLIQHFCGFIKIIKENYLRIALHEWPIYCMNPIGLIYQPNYKNTWLLQLQICKNQFFTMDLEFSFWTWKPSPKWAHYFSINFLTNIQRLIKLNWFHYFQFSKTAVTYYMVLKAINE